MEEKKSIVLPLVIVGAVVLILAGASVFLLNRYYAKKSAELAKKAEILEEEGKKSKKATETATKTTPTTTTETASECASGTKIYDNTTYGYSFCYPNADSMIDYMTDRSSGSHIDQGKIVVIDENVLAEDYIPYESEMPISYFWISANDQVYDLSTVSADGADATISDITVDGESAKKIVYHAPQMMIEEYITTIYVNHGARGYYIAWENSDASGSHDAEIDAIVSSIKFK